MSDIIFTHLHVHSHFSILDGMSKINELVDKCQRTGMHSMALTDHGNMFGIKELLKYSKEVNGKIKDQIKEQQAIADDNDKSDDEKDAARQEIERLNATFFKPIVGIEAYCAPVSRHSKKSREDRGWHLILLAKNSTGYKNLCRLATLAYTEGFYYNPRIDHELLEQCHEGIICSSACIAGEVPRKILNGDVKGAEESMLWFKNLFGDDYYLELQRHKTDKPDSNTEAYEQQQVVNKYLLEWSQKYNIRVIATNDVHFVEEEHAEAHDRLICVSTNTPIDAPDRMHYSKQEWLKTPDEMYAVFSDVPEALSNTQEVVDKVEVYDIDSDPIMPVFPIPESFGSEAEYRSRITKQELFDEFTRNEDGKVVMSQEEAEKKIKKLGDYDKLYRIKFEADYLKKLVYEGARYRYGDTLNDEQTERIKFELHTIKTMGFPGYFLIVSDYIRGAREKLDVSVGPGRGSAAGSVVAYCLKITDIDPLKYNLLFERFLNPDRISLPDIDVDFDDAGRGKVLDWITDKYGKERVAHIITYGVMASKSAIADMCRLHNVPIPVSNALKAFVPERSFDESIKDEKGKEPKVNLKNCYKYIPELRAIMENGDLSGLKDVSQIGECSPQLLQSVLHYAEELEGTNRQIGIHACGVIIGADDLYKFAPLCTIKDKESGNDVLVTQYDGHVVEQVGLIKMDFLGLKNLTVIKDTQHMVRKNHGVELDIDHIPIDDELTFKLYQEGSTIGTFQFESAGMQNYLRQLKPTVFEDLIAMNALYRPGPLDYIPSFIDRKQGRETIAYDDPDMEEYLRETYGITVYQEQVMLLSRKLAGFTRGESDTLRKAMGKKQIDKMLELKDKFIKQGVEHGHDAEVLEKIWKDWEKFASYAFNKSHATCYAWVAYQTAYLKAHYPAEYMSAVMTSSKGNPDELTKLLAECRRMGLEILLPHINQSEVNFSVNKQGQILFGFSAIKGMGDSASIAVIEEREKNGPFSDIFDFLSRVKLGSMNSKNLEVLVKSGAMDDFELHRAQYFQQDTPGDNQLRMLDKLMKWATQQQNNANSAQTSIFDMSEDLKEEVHPIIPECEPWSNIERCRYEYEVLGFYLSGHPMDDFKLTIQNFTDHTVDDLNNLDKMANQDFHIACMVTGTKSGISQKSGNAYGSMMLEDYAGRYELKLFGSDYLKFKNYCSVGLFLYITGHVQQWTRKDENGKEISSRPRLMPSEMMALGDVMNRKCRSIRFRVALSDVTETFCAQLQKMAKHCNAKAKEGASVGVIVDDYARKRSLNMNSLTLHVDPSQFLHALQQMPQVTHISLNGKVR